MYIDKQLSIANFMLLLIVVLVHGSTFCSGIKYKWLSLVHHTHICSVLIVVHPSLARTAVFLCSRFGLLAFTVSSSWVGLLSMQSVFQRGAAFSLARWKSSGKGHACWLVVNYKRFPQWNQRQFDFFLSQPNSILQFFSEKLLMTGKRAAKQPLCGFFGGSWHVLQYMVHVTPLCVLWKLLKALDRVTFSVTDVRFTSCFSRKR